MSGWVWFHPWIGEESDGLFQQREVLLVLFLRQEKDNKKNSHSLFRSLTHTGITNDFSSRTGLKRRMSVGSILTDFTTSNPACRIKKTAVAVFYGSSRDAWSTLNRTQIPRLVVLSGTHPVFLLRRNPPLSRGDFSTPITYPFGNHRRIMCSYIPHLEKYVK